jgi:hypothetical protein
MQGNKRLNQRHVLRFHKEVATRLWSALRPSSQTSASDRGVYEFIDNNMADIGSSSKPEGTLAAMDGTHYQDPNEPTAEELKTLRKVPDNLPWSAFLVAVVELCERFTYYG